MNEKPTATPSDALCEQHARIARAIELLRADFEAMSDTINPEKATWRDVARFAKTADLAREILAWYHE